MVECECVDSVGSVVSDVTDMELYCKVYNGFVTDVPGQRIPLSSVIGHAVQEELCM
jgi:hypothetical protein